MAVENGDRLGSQYAKDVQALIAADYPFDAKAAFRLIIKPEIQFGLWLLPDGQILEIKGQELRTLSSVEARRHRLLVYYALNEYLEGKETCFAPSTGN